MKKSYFYIFLGASIATLLLVSACRKTPLEGLQVLLDTDFIPNTIDIGIFDAATGLPITDVVPTVDFAVSSRNSGAKVLAVSGGDIEVAEGFVSVTIKPDQNPDFGGENLLFEGGMSVNALGYLPNSLPILLYEESKQAMKVFLVKTDALPTGVNWGNSPSPLANNGIIQSALSIETGSTLGGSASLAIPQGLEVRSSDGTAITGNNTAALIAHISPNMGDALSEIYAGGLIARSRKNGNLTTTAFASAALVNVQIQSANGKKNAASLSGNFEIKVEIPTTITNPVTGAVLQSGDQIPLWYLESNLGVWREKGLADIILNTSGNFEATLTDSLMGYYALQWEYPAMGCNEGGQVILNSALFADSSAVFGKLNLSIGSRLLRSEYISGRIGDTIALPMVPKESISVEFRDYKGNLLGSAVTDFCGFTSEMQVTPPAGAVTCKEATVAAFCPKNPDILFKPTIGYWFQEGTTGEWVAGRMVNGTAAFCGEIGKTYTVALAFDGTLRDSTFVYDASANLDLGVLNLGGTKYCQ